MKLISCSVIGDTSCPIGISEFHFTTSNGRRWHTAKAYLRPAMSRKNLDVVVDAHVTKVSHA